jgi:hypothetical protein
MPACRDASSNMLARPARAAAARSAVGGEGTRVFPAYELRDGPRMWIITEADRSVTTSCFPTSTESVISVTEDP